MILYQSYIGIFFALLKLGALVRKQLVLILLYHPFSVSLCVFLYYIFLYVRAILVPIYWYKNCVFFAFPIIWHTIIINFQRILISRMILTCCTINVSFVSDVMVEVLSFMTTTYLVLNIKSSVDLLFFPLWKLFFPLLLQFKFNWLLFMCPCYPFKRLHPIYFWIELLWIFLFNIIWKSSKVIIIYFSPYLFISSTHNL